ncbi:MAG TPA: hypothetical protein VLH77_02225, partial [Gammaproteobacteria bacterium]|nr:hypothetical protein [Gammaproteobacteria bacterium]
LQVALQKGYPAIRELHKKTKLGIKGKIKKAAITNPNLNLVIPNTFIKMLILKKLKSLKKSIPDKLVNKIYQIPFFDLLPNVKQVFAEVVAPEGQEATLKSTTARLGKLRANNRYFDAAHTLKRKIFSNNLKIGCESKIHQIEFYSKGREGSDEAKREYEKHSKDKIVMRIEQAFVFLRKERDDWVRCEDDYQGEYITADIRDLQDWRNEKKKHEQENGASAPFMTLEEWLKINRKEPRPPEIKIFEKGQEIKARQDRLLSSRQEAHTSAELTKQSAASPAMTSYKGQIELRKWAATLLNECKAKQMGKKIYAGKLGSLVKEALKKHEKLSLITEKGKLAPWLKNVFPPDDLIIRKNLAVFLRSYYEKLGQLSEVQFQALKQIKKDQSELLPQAYAGVEKNLLDAFATEAAKNVKLKIFLVVALPLIEHQKKIRCEFTENLALFAELRKQRQPDWKTDLRIAEKLKVYEEKMKELFRDPLMDISAWHSALLKDIEDIKFGTQNLKAGLAIDACEPLVTPRKTSTLSFLNQRERGLEPASLEAHTRAKREPLTHELSLTRHDQIKINVTLREHVTSTNKPVSDLSKLDPALDPVHIFSTLAQELKDREGKSVFPERELAKKCSTQALSHLRSHSHRFTKAALQEFLSTVSPWKEQFKNIDAEKVQAFLDLGMKTYKNATEQFEAYPVKSSKYASKDDPYESDNYLPSDAIIHLAKYHVDSYLSLCETDDPKIVIRS